MNNIVLSDHARKQLKERNLSEIEILKTINKPDKIIQQSTLRHKALKIIHKNKKQYLLIVVYDIKNITKEIVTAFLTSKITKYL